MPHHAAFSLARLYGPAVAVKGSLRRASPALDRAHRTSSQHTQPTQISKEVKTDILESRCVFDTGWKYEINNFQIPDESQQKQYEGIERLLDITLGHCYARQDWRPAIFFCYRLLELEIKQENFRFALDCVLRIGRDYTTCLAYVAPFLIDYRERLTGDERDLIREWGRRIPSADAGRGHDFEIVWVLLICGALGLRVDQSYIGVADRVVSPLVLAVLGLLHADNLLVETWDD